MKKRILSTLMSLVLLLSVFPIGSIRTEALAPTAVTLPSVTENENQADGVVFRKGVTPHLVNGQPDGTVDIIIEAYTTGVVRHTTTNVPTDIILVLDVSGSMDDEVVSTTTTTTYSAANASNVERGFLIWTDDYYGFPSTYTTYYINVGTATDHYVEVQHAGVDAYNCDYYWYSGENDQRTYVYPAPASGTREFNYPVVQFYSRTVQTDREYAIDALKTAVDTFIETTHQKNAEILENGGTHLHRIALVKFGSASYAGGSASIAEGNDTFGSGSNEYNYTQVVKNLTVVNDDGHNELEDAVADLKPGGATAVDYGLNLAKMVLDSAAQSSSSVQRNKVVIVFSDGNPTHSNNFDTDVANDAIAIANDIKFTGATVYSISVANDTDVTDVSSNINKFFHYVSSNYPNAQSLTVEGEDGDKTRGYYMTPTDTESLAMLFEAIAQEIESPTIELGSSAEIVDTVSAYFTLPDGTDSITLETADRVNNNGTFGWKDPQPAVGLTKTVRGKTLEVHGFDYDENYISDTSRGQDYYGTKLIITINAAPDYAMLDTHAASIEGGYIPSNDGTANLLNTAGENVASVPSPHILANTVTYRYTAPDASSSQVYRTQYRLPGGETSVITDVPTAVGYTFTGWTLTSPAGVTVAADGSYTMPGSDVVFTGSFAVNTHDVTYEITGYNPGASIPNDANKTDVPYGASVSIIDDLSLTGYTFSGWSVETPAGLQVANGGFSMPDSDVKLIGYFTPADGVAYKTIHYIQNLDGVTYSVKEEIPGAGTTGDNVHAVKRTYEGFTLDESVQNVTVVYDDQSTKTLSTVSSGTIAADGSLVLHQFHTRNKYPVTYHYDGAVLTNPPALPVETDEFFYGAQVPIQGHEEQDDVLNYTFAGWHSLDGTTVTDDDTSFEMPIGGMKLYGHFSPITGVDYTVEHHLQSADDPTQYVKQDGLTETYTGTAGERVTAAPKKITGYTYNESASYISDVIPDPSLGTLTLIVRYDLAGYTVTYKYDGTVPAGHSPLPPTQTDVKYLSDVNVAPNATAPNHEFSGWSIETPAGVTITDGVGGKTFEMPASNVVLVGSFSAYPEYDVEYWLQQPDGSYKKDTEASHTHVAPDGKDVSAHIMTFAGYEKITHADSKESGTVTAGSKLVLKVFYDLIPYTVTFEVDGQIPVGVPATQTLTNKYYNDTITTPDYTNISGYSFAGWTSAEVGAVTPGGSFTMPAKNVTLKGTFTALDANYVIEHYLMNDEGNYVGVSPDIEIKAGIVGDSVRVTAYQPYLTMGARVDMQETQSAGAWEGVVIADDPATTAVEQLVLKIYYSREANIRVEYHYANADWQSLGWPELPTDSRVYYVGAEVEAQGFATAPAEMKFDGWYASNPTIQAAPGETFTVPRLTGDNPVVKLYGRWVSNVFTVKYFVDGNEYSTMNYSFGTPVTIMDKIPDTAGRTYTAWSQPVSVTDGVPVITNPDGTITMAAAGEIHINCTSTANSYKVSYYLNNQLYKEVPVAAGEEHVILPGPTTFIGLVFTGWSAPRTAGGDAVTEYNVSGGRAFTMPAANVEIYGSTMVVVIPTSELVIEKEVIAPDGFTGGKTYTFFIYEVNGTQKTLEETVTVTVGANGKGSSAPIFLSSGADYLVEEAPAGVAGYILDTVAKNDAGAVLGAGETIRVPLSTSPTKIAFTNTYTEIPLVTDDHFGYIIGYPDGTVRPENNITRAEIATIFFRLLTDEKRAEYWAQSNSFTDVSSDAWYNNAVSTLAKAGVLEGYEDNTYRPDRAITRAELVKIAMSFYGGGSAAAGTAFGDTSGHWAASFINAAAEMGFIEGDGSGTFDPDRPVTRAEAMKIINRTLGRAPHKDYLLPGMIIWSDNADRDAWYYAEVQEATNSHAYSYVGEHEIWEAILPVRDWAALEKMWSDAND